MRRLLADQRAPSEDPHKLSYILLEAYADATGYEPYIRHVSDIILGVGGMQVLKVIGWNPIAVY